MIAPNGCPTLFAAHDSGLIQLPAEVSRVREALDDATERLRAHTMPPQAVHVRSDVAVATVEAMLTGAKLPEVSMVLEAEEAQRRAEHELEIVRNVVEMLGHRLSQTVVEHADALIVEVLGPVYDDLTGRMREAHELLEPFETAPRGALAMAKADVRKAAATLDEWTNQYTVLGAAGREVRKLGPQPTHDTQHEFATWRDIHEVWPRERRTALGATPAPWEAAPDPLAWQFRHLTAWMPTTADQDAEWLKVYGQQLREEQINAEKRQAMAVAVTGR